MQKRWQFKSKNRHKDYFKAEVPIKEK